MHSGDRLGSLGTLAEKVSGTRYLMENRGEPTRVGINGKEYKAGDSVWCMTYMPPIVTVAQVRSGKAGVPSPGPVAALM